MIDTAIGWIVEHGIGSLFWLGFFLLRPRVGEPGDRVKSSHPSLRNELTGWYLYLNRVPEVEIGEGVCKPWFVLKIRMFTEVPEEVRNVDLTKELGCGNRVVIGALG